MRIRTQTKNKANPVISKTTRGCIRVYREIPTDNVIFQCINSVDKTFTVREGMHELVISREDTVEKTVHDGIIEDDSSIVIETLCEMEAPGIIGHGMTATIAITTGNTLSMTVRTEHRAVTVQSSAWTEDQRNTASGTR